MTPSAQPTPTPWNIAFGGREGDGYATIGGKFCNYAIAELTLGTPEANAALIVRAVNAHDALVAALARLLRVSSVELAGRRDDVLDQARAALKLAEGGVS